MAGVRWFLVWLVLLLLPGQAAAMRLLVLPLQHRGPEAERARSVEKVLLEAVASLDGIVRIEPAAPIACAAHDVDCLAGIARAAGADRVLSSSLRPVGPTQALLLLSVPADGSAADRVSETLAPGSDAEALVRERVVGLLAPDSLAGGLDVEASEGSRIFVDGELRGTAPLPAPIGGLRPGQHQLRVERAGAGEARSYVEIRFARVTRVRIEPRSDQVALVGFDPQLRREEPAPPVQVREPELAPSPGLLRSPALRWGLLAAGALAVGGGVLPVVDGQSLREERDSLRDGEGRFAPADRSREAALRASYEKRQTASTVLFATGGVLLAGAGALFVLELVDGPGAGAAVVATPGGVGLASEF